MKDVKFSIIIPAYNVEKYIKETLESVLKQDYDNYEVIVVDDGSIDKTVSIIKEFTDKRITLIKQKNKGVSAARNQGLKKATGDYIVFIDGDDYIEPWVLSRIAKRIKSSKTLKTYVGLFNTVYEQENSRKCDCGSLEKEKINNKSCDKALDYLYKKRIIYTVWRFIMPRSIIMDNNLFFVEGIIHEDEEWVPRMLASSIKFELIEEPFYNYRVRSKSIMTSTYDNLYEEKCLVDVTNRLLELGSNEATLYKRNLYLRNSYKNMFQTYLKIREKANPIEPDYGKEVSGLKKNILIYGSSRSGKSTLANLLKNKLRYSVISLDNLVSAFDKGLPDLGIERSNRDGTAVKQLKPFFDAYINSLTGMSQKAKGYNYVIEGAFFSIDTLKHFRYENVVLILISGYKTPKELFNAIRTHDNLADWTSNYNDEQLLSYCENVINNEKYIIDLCKEYNFDYIVTGYDRVKVFDSIIEKIESMVRE